VRIVLVVEVTSGSLVVVGLLVWVCSAPEVVVDDWVDT
jgi:uncharacterized membrane protein YphA (DoxX/SURF4 family)